MRATTRLALLATSAAPVAPAIGVTAAQAEDGGSGNITIDKVVVNGGKAGRGRYHQRSVRQGLRDRVGRFGHRRDLVHRARTQAQAQAQATVTPRLVESPRRTSSRDTTPEAQGLNPPLARARPSRKCTGLYPSSAGRA